MENLDNINDLQLFYLMKDGNKLAFRCIYNRYWKRLIAYTYNILNDKGLAEDVLQDVFTNIWIKRKEINVTSLENYLFVSVRNKSISQFRKMKFTTVDDEIIHGLNLSEESSDVIEMDDLKHSIKIALEDLPSRCKEIFYMSRYENYTNEEIAEHFNITKRTVENQLSLALKHVRGNLKKIWSTIPSILFYWLS